MKALAWESVPPSGLVTVTVRLPVLAKDSIETFAFSSVELTKVVDSTITPEPNEELAPPAKPLPLMTTVSVPFLLPEFGLADSTFGSALTVNPPASVSTPPSGLVTVTVRAPVLAPASTETFADSSVELTKVVDSTVMPEPNDDVAPLTKPLPLIDTVCLLAP